MRKMSLSVACLMALFAAPLAAQQPQVDLPPQPRADSPRTYAEQASPVSFGTTVIAGGDGHLTVADVSDGSIASQAGLRAGDHIVSIDGQLLTEPVTFNEYVAARPTAPLSIIVLRDGKQETIVVHPAGAAAKTTSESHSRPALGLRFLQSPQVIISETVAGSPAAGAGLLAGDQIISVNGEVVSSSDQFITLVAAAPLSEPLELGVLRGTERSTVSITPAAWETVFTSTEAAYTTLKPVAPATTTVTPVIGWGLYGAPWYNPYYISNVSPVVVPLAWYGYYPYSVYPYGYGYTYWNVYNPGNFYYSVWPNGPYYYGGPYPGPVHEVKPAVKELDSAGTRLQPGDRTVSRVIE
jgi:membrane-associated protease RseP (regulator of RpoE activity)